ncbi:MAG: UDP-N-acetylmuramoyl-L-alanyl-D-glutamate--2,6-diaminopimelate ligase, partial [Muribaculaceae bacterium]|nr:UDP-N-acetylmuramoyl-L-alanyl-D-glutamate--2,6-diaminopimelate ligase [Muribaculaceae bacterium]
QRARMGETASRFPARGMVSSVNPRDEDASAIADDIVSGITGENVSVSVILDRAQAIATAVADAAPGDVVLVAGKGHETYQEFENRRRIHFDDREEAVKAINLRNK